MEKKLRVLAVEDEDIILDFMQKYLTRRGFDVHVATDAESALESLSTFQPDVMLLDVSLPGMDGYELAKRISENERWSDIPIVFMSGFDIRDDAARSFAAGGTLYIRKPFDINTLVETVNAVVGL